MKTTFRHITAAVSIGLLGAGMFIDHRTAKGILIGVGITLLLVCAVNGGEQ